MAVSYAVKLDTERDGTFGAGIDDVSQYVISMRWANGQSSTYQDYASPQQANFVLLDTANVFSQDNPSAPYYGKLRPSTLIKIIMTVGTTTQQMWIGKLASVRAAVGEYAGTHIVQILATDLAYLLQNTEFIPALQTNARIDEGVAAALSSGSFYYPYNNSPWLLGISLLGVNTYLTNPSSYYSLEQSYVTLDYIGDALQSDGRTTLAQFIQMLVSTEGVGRFFWDGKQSKFTFHNRYHDALSDTHATLANADYKTLDISFGDDVANDISVRYTQRTTGTPLSVLASNSTSTVIRAGLTRVIRLSYKDPNGEANRCAGLNVVSPVDMTDIVYSGGSLTISSDVGATSCEVTLSNGGATDVTVTLIQVRGTPLLQYDVQEIRKVDVTSLMNYDRRSLVIETPIQDPAEADLYARNLARRFKDAKTRISSVEVQINDGTMASTAQQLSIGDTIILTESASGINTAYIVVGEIHNVADGGKSHVFQWLLKDKALESVWILGDTALSILGQTTYPA